MPKLKLTARAIERLPAPDPSGKQTLYWDTELRGFGVLAREPRQTRRLSYNATCAVGLPAG